uniref:Uncharacterized protein n=1 Tax=Glossina pallidipes TaxID=7398 RepID=A0A1A9ZDY1_GLOPL
MLTCNAAHTRTFDCGRRSNSWNVFASRETDSVIFSYTDLNSSLVSAIKDRKLTARPSTLFKSYQAYIGFFAQRRLLSNLVFCNAICVEYCVVLLKLVQKQKHYFLLLYMPSHPLLLYNFYTKAYFWFLKD